MEGHKINYESLNELSSMIHQRNKDKGFYDESRNIGEILMLIVSELGEALEAMRKDHWANNSGYHNDIIENNKSFTSAFEDNLKDTFQDEIADSMIRLFDLCGYLQIDIAQAVDLKLKYNATRPYKHGKKF